MVGNQNFRKSSMQKHEKSLSHRRCTAAQLAEKQDTPAEVIAGILTLTPEMREGMRNLFHCAYSVIRNEKPFTDYPEAVGLCRRTGSKIPTYYSSDKACAR